MQTNISAKYLATAQGREADQILRSCVHCGFCTATCPTYQLLGDELDGPRGRIYLIKQMLEGEAVTQTTQLHLDRCLTCRACETTCPSGVRYGRLVDIGRELVEQRVGRGVAVALQRWLLRMIIPYRRRFGLLWRLGLWLRPLLPSMLKQKLPTARNVNTPAPQRHPRRMLVLQGCAQSVATPATNRAASQVLDKLGIQLIEVASASCCGALSHHLSAAEEALTFARRNIDAWWPFIEQGVEAIVISASGCGVMVKDYGALLAHDKDYADRAQRVSALAHDLSEVLIRESFPPRKNTQGSLRIAFHSPCTLQHGQQLKGLVEEVLTRVGFELVQVHDSHLCCGSAGTYSILQPELSQRLLVNKLAALQRQQPDVIATANVGCQLHMTSKASVPVKHWIELLYEALG
jgi:glycolate oxidase iron-sulfur subunit